MDCAKKRKEAKLSLVLECAKQKEAKNESGGGDRGGCFASAADLLGLWPRPHNPDQIRAGSWGLGFIFKLAM